MKVVNKAKMTDLNYTGSVKDNRLFNGLSYVGGGNEPLAAKIEEFDGVYYNRRPRKMLSWHFQRRLVREMGDMISGDYCRVPEYEITVDEYQQNDNVKTSMAYIIFRMRWKRRSRTDAPVPMDADVRSFNARFV